MGASIKAYKPVGKTPEEVGRLTAGDPVEDGKGIVELDWGKVGDAVAGDPVCKAD